MRGAVGAGRRAARLTGSERAAAGRRRGRRRAAAGQGHAAVASGRRAPDPHAGRRWLRRTLSDRPAAVWLAVPAVRILPAHGHQGCSSDRDRGRLRSRRGDGPPARGGRRASSRSSTSTPTRVRPWPRSSARSSSRPTSPTPSRWPRRSPPPPRTRPLRVGVNCAGTGTAVRTIGKDGTPHIRNEWDRVLGHQPRRHVPVA